MTYMALFNCMGRSRNVNMVNHFFTHQVRNENVHEFFYTCSLWTHLNNMSFVHIFSQFLQIPAILSPVELDSRSTIATRLWLNCQAQNLIQMLCVAVMCSCCCFSLTSLRFGFGTHGLIVRTMRPCFSWSVWPIKCCCVWLTLPGIVCRPAWNLTRARMHTHTQIHLHICVQSSMHHCS